MRYIMPGRKFSTEGQQIDVTRIQRPDLAWAVVDTHGHEHFWCEDGSRERAVEYAPMKHYVVPTVRWVVDREGSDEWPEDGHHECLVCGDTVDPGLCADLTRQFIPGLIEYFIDDRPVTKEEYERELQIEMKERGISYDV